MLEDLDGFLLVDKPAGIAFSTVVKTVKRKFNLVKVGHGGSLDTSASGLLVLLVNDANKFVDVVMGADRVYTGVMRLGRRTDTHDMHGRTLGGNDAATLHAKSSIKPSLRSAATSFRRSRASARSAAKERRSMKSPIPASTVSSCRMSTVWGRLILRRRR